jgi:hypothetical protein
VAGREADPARHRQARREDRAHAGDVVHVAERRLDAMAHEERGETSLPLAIGRGAVEVGAERESKEGGEARRAIRAAILQQSSAESRCANTVRRSGPRIGRHRIDRCHLIRRTEAVQTLIELTQGAPVSAALLAVIVAVSLIGLYRIPAWIERNLLRPYWLVRRGEYATLVTSGFIHADIAHLLFNGFTLWAFAFPLERTHARGGSDAVHGPGCWSVRSEPG